MPAIRSAKAGISSPRSFTCPGASSRRSPSVAASTGKSAARPLCLTSASSVSRSGSPGAARLLTVSEPVPSTAKGWMEPLPSQCRAARPSVRGAAPKAENHASRAEESASSPVAAALKAHGAARAICPVRFTRFRSSITTRPCAASARPAAAVTARSTFLTVPVRQRSRSAVSVRLPSVPVKSRRCHSASGARMDPLDVRLPPSGTGRSGRRRSCGSRGTSGRSAFHSSAAVRASSSRRLPDS